MEMERTELHERIKLGFKASSMELNAKNTA